MRAVDGISATATIVAAHPEDDEPALREAARLAGACGNVLKDNLLELRRLLENQRTLEF